MSLGGAVGAAVCLSAPWAWAAQYRITDLGTLGGDYSAPGGINAFGQVVGGSNLGVRGPTHAFFYDGTQMIDLGTLGGGSSWASAINDDGRVVGLSYVNADVFHAFQGDRTGITDLGTLGGANSVGMSINNPGNMGGWSDASGGIHALTREYGALLDRGAGMAINALNYSADSAGWFSPIGSGARHAFVRDARVDGTGTHFADGALHDLGTLGGANSFATALTDPDNLGSRTVVGYSEMADGSRHAFLNNTTDPRFTTDLRTLGGKNSQAVSVNGAKVVGGSSETLTDGIHAFIYDGKMRDLNTMIPSDSGWTLFEANGINDVGQIAATGIDRQGRFHAVLLTPTGPFRPLGDLSDGVFDSRANAVSADGGVAVGVGTGGGGKVQAVRWTPHDAPAVRAFGTGTPMGVSADGATAVGFLRTNGIDRAIRWTPSGVDNLGVLLPTDTVSSANGVSANGSVVVGTSGTSGNVTSQPFRWTASGGMSGLGTLGGRTGAAVGVSGDGNVVAGTSERTDHLQHAFRWTASEGMRDLGSFDGVFSTASAISLDGSTIVGWSSKASVSRAFRWTQGGGMTDLGTLSGAGSLDNFYATGVSGDGSIIVGKSDRAGVVSDPFIWDRVYGMRRLADVLAVQKADLEGWTLLDVSAISADGTTIVGSGRYGLLQTAQPFVATLPVNALAYTPGDASGDGRIDFNDLTILAQHYNTSGTQYVSEGDLNQDGTVDFNDLVILAQGYNTVPVDASAAGGSGAFEADLAAAFAGVPEPGSLGLALTAACAALRRRSRSRPSRCRWESYSRP